MSKVQMPEPTVLRTVMPDDYRYGHVYGYTRKHMAAYADARVREEATQTAAMAIRLIMSLDRYHYGPCAQHRQQETGGEP